MAKGKHRILVLGAQGQLGASIRTIHNDYPGSSFTFTDVGELDITDSGALKDHFAANEYDFVINCAGYTAVDRAESDEEAAFRLNAGAPAEIAGLIGDTGVLFIHISTDYVFDGRKNRPYHEEDEPGPLSVYGTSKLKGEQELRMTGAPCLCIRTSWLYSEFGHNFMKTILNKAKTDPEIKVIFDQTGTPTYAGDLARAILEIIPKLDIHNFELYHLSNEGVASWYDFAVAIVNAAGTDTRVIPVETGEFDLPAKRPYYSVMNKKRIRDDFGLCIPHWHDSLLKAIQNPK